MLDIFEMIRSNGEHTKEYVHEKMFTFLKYQMDVKEIKCFFIMVEETWINVSHWWFSCLTHSENCRFTNWKNKK